MIWGKILSMSPLSVTEEKARVKCSYHEEKLAFCSVLMRAHLRWSTGPKRFENFRHYVCLDCAAEAQAEYERQRRTSLVSLEQLEKMGLHNASSPSSH